MNEVLKWKRDYLRVFDARCNYTPKDYDPIFRAKERAAYSEAKRYYKFDVDSFLYLASVEFARPLYGGFLYFVRNHPFEYAAHLDRLSQELGINCSIPGQFRQHDGDLFYNLTEMTRYGLHILFSHINVTDSAEKQLLSSIEYEDYDSFKHIVETERIDFNALKTISGVISFLDSAYKTDGDDAAMQDALFLWGITPEQIEKALKDVLDIGKYDYSSCSKEQLETASGIVYSAFAAYSICDILDTYERSILDSVLTNPKYSVFSSAAQWAYYSIFEQLPQDFTQLISINEDVERSSEDNNDTRPDPSVHFDFCLVLPTDFFTNAEYVDGSIPTIKSLPKWVTDGDGKVSTFAAVINYLADKKYIGGSLGNRRKMASILSGRKLETNMNEVEWLQQKNKSIVETEKVMLWLCWFFYRGYAGVYDKAYTIFWKGKGRSFKKGDVTSYITHADEEIRNEIMRMYPDHPSR